jgi:dimethylglycine dehydrogenase
MVAVRGARVRERAGLMDITAFTKVEVSRARRRALLDRLWPTGCRKPGGIALTHMLNRRGRIELETTVVRMARGPFYLVCAAFFEQRLLDHLSFNRDGADAKIINRSRRLGGARLNGPKGARRPGACTDAALDNAAFRWLSAQEIRSPGTGLGVPHVLCRRTGLGAAHAREACWPSMTRSGRRGAHGIADYGSFAMNACGWKRASRARAN